MTLNSNKPILYIGIGIIFYLAEASTNFLLKDLLRILLLNIGGNSPLLIVMVIILFQFLFSVIVAISFINYLKKRKFNPEKIFFFMVIIMIIAQCLQFLIPLIINQFFGSKYYLNTPEYNEFINQNMIYSIIDLSLDLMKYVIVVVLFYRNRNQIIFKSADDSLNP